MPKTSTRVTRVRYTSKGESPSENPSLLLALLSRVNGVMNRETSSSAIGVHASLSHESYCQLLRLIILFVKRIPS